MKQVCRGLFALAVLAGSTLLTISISMPVTVAADRDQPAQPAPPALIVPADLKPLLVGPASEMRLVVTRYQADRNTLAGNYRGADRSRRRRRRTARWWRPAPAPVRRRRPHRRCRCRRRGSRA